MPRTQLKPKPMPTSTVVETQFELLARAAERNKLNYTELAKALGVIRQAISQFRYGGPMSMEVSLRLAALLKDSPEYVLACTEYNKLARMGRPAKELEVFEKIAKAFKR